MAPSLSPNQAQTTRLASRTGTLTTPTSSLAPGHIQANILILPTAAAADFLDLCDRNPVPCPLLGHTPLSSPGNPHLLTSSLHIKLPAAGADASSDPIPKPLRLINTDASGSPDFDIRTDLPLYNIYSAGAFVAQKTDIIAEWDTNEHVAFLIGCSFSFESALARAGLPPRHWERSSAMSGSGPSSLGAKNVPMYRTTRALNPAGIFCGPRLNYVVSMRPYRVEEVEHVREVTRPFGRMHGEPVAWGWEAVRELGIGDIDEPEFGESVRIRDGEVPVFWGCGVTPQIAIMEAGDKIRGMVMAHAPGHMLVLDVREDDILGRA